MVNLIFALGSMLVLLLVLTFLPIGFTFKGKSIISLVSFVLAIGGVAAVAVASIPLWQTALMFAALSFFIAYFMDNRIGTLIYKENLIITESLEEYEEIPDGVYHLDTVKSVELVKVNNELSVLDSIQLNMEKGSDLEVKQEEKLPEIAKKEVENLEKINEDISFLIERNIEEEADEGIIESDSEIGYLSDIESLLAVVTVEKTEATDYKLEDIIELSPQEIQEKLPSQLEKEVEPLDDSLFDFLLATKEVASGNDDTLEEIKTKEKVSLQK